MTLESVETLDVVETTRNQLRTFRSAYFLTGVALPSDTMERQSFLALFTRR